MSKVVICNLYFFATLVMSVLWNLLCDCFWRCQKYRIPVQLPKLCQCERNCVQLHFVCVYSRSILLCTCAEPFFRSDFVLIHLSPHRTAPHCTAHVHIQARFGNFFLGKSTNNYTNSTQHPALPH